jgi:amidase
VAERELLSQYRPLNTLAFGIVRFLKFPPESERPIPDALLGSEQIDIVFCFLSYHMEIVMDRRDFIAGVTAASASTLVGAQSITPRAGKVPTRAGQKRRKKGEGPLWTWTAVELASSIRSGDITSRQATESCLQRMREVNPIVNAVAESLEAEALAAATAADQLTKRNRNRDLPPLHGVPVTTKINVDLAGHATTHGIVALKDAIAPEDSSAVANLRKAGAVIIGRTNVPAFAFRWFADNDLHGRTLNPWLPSRTPGGSSGGAASAVSVGIGPIAHGNDIAGSIRYPAYCCGVAGIRPSLGRVPSFNPSSAQNLRGIAIQLMAVEGLLSRSVGDLRLALPALASRDPRDAWWSPVKHDFGPLPDAPRVAIVTRQDGIEPDPEVAQGLRTAASILQRAGFKVEEVTPPSFKEAAELWSPFVLTESGALLQGLAQQIGDNRIKKAINTWLDVTPLLDLPGLSQALGMREKIRREWQQFMETYPIIITPISWRTPFALDYDQQGADAFKEILKAQSPCFTIPFLGLPALSVPTGVINGIPTGVQVVANWFREDHCFEVGEIIESAVNMTAPIDPKS